MVFRLFGAVVVLCGMLAVGSPVGAQEGAGTLVLEAGDTIGAALAWSGLLEDGAVEEALLSRHDTFVDALASGAAQYRETPDGVVERPLLLTQRDSLDDRVLAELQRLGVGKVVIIGGEGAVSRAVEEELTANGFAVERVRGSDRVTTAVALAQRFPPDRSHYVLARGFWTGTDITRGFADSLAAGAVGSVLLTETERL